MQDVTKDRNKYIGGSDIPIILGISSFNDRFSLLQEKAGILDREFNGNEYTEYGNKLEPLIRDFINTKKKKKFVEDVKIIDDLRGHFDGFNGSEILEIKTTSQIKKTVDDYKNYLVQLVFYMHIAGVKKGTLAVYERPENFDLAFEEKRLNIYEIKLSDYKELLQEVLDAVDSFKTDLEKIKIDPFLTEEDLLPTEIIELSNKVETLEIELAKFKEIETSYKEFKTKLHDEMTKHNIKSWKTNGGYKITRVLPTPDKTEQKLDETKLKKEYKDVYNDCLTDKITKGKAGYIKITAPKGA